MITFENESLAIVVDEILNKYAPDKNQSVKHAEALWVYVDLLMNRRKVRDLYEVKGITDILKASCYIYNLFVCPERVSTFLLLREKTKVVFDAYGIPVDLQDKIFQMCECHLGEESPLDFLIPQKGYPDDLFADALFMLCISQSVGSSPSDSHRASHL